MFVLAGAVCFKIIQCLKTERLLAHACKCLESGFVDVVRAKQLPHRHGCGPGTQIHCGPLWRLPELKGV